MSEQMKKYREDGLLFETPGRRCPMPDDLTALRDRLAGLCGWEQYKGKTALGGWHRQGEYAPHPFPPGSIDALAAAWPEGWGWGRCDCNADGHGELLEWYAFHHDGLYSRVGFADTGDEYADRLRLTVAVREAMGEDGV